MSVGKSPLNELKKKLNVSWEHAVQDFGLETSKGVGKGVKCVNGNFEETGNERLELRQSFMLYSTTLGLCEYKAGAGTAVSQNSPLRNWTERDSQHLFPQLSPRGY